MGWPVPPVEFVIRREADCEKQKKKTNTKTILSNIVAREGGVCVVLDGRTAGNIFIYVTTTGRPTAESRVSGVPEIAERFPQNETKSDSVQRLQLRRKRCRLRDRLLEEGGGRVTVVRKTQTDRIVGSCRLAFPAKSTRRVSSPFEIS